MKITIDTELVTKLIAKGNDIFLEPDGDKSLQTFLEMKALLDQAEQDIKDKLEATASRFNPNFKSIHGDHVVVYRRSYGSQYYVEEDKIDKVPQELYETHVDATFQLAARPISEIVKAAGEAGFVVTKKKKAGKEVYSIDRKVDSKAIEKWVKENGGMPYGIFEDTERKSSLTIKLKDNEK
ncbi:MAG: hypothetical protein MOGMAGMI_01821 [Candidatus Omnitrophica bacterium]|nr:hypothetical protein [Candidatus Omnitrophota bacterium]